MEAKVDKIVAHWQNPRQGAGRTTVAQLRARVLFYGERCWVCRGPASGTDHVKPLSKGGSNWPANLRPICTNCNLRKGNQWPWPPPAPEDPRVELRRERVKIAYNLRVRGLLMREIADVMGCGISTVSGYFSDPDGGKLRARKQSYGRVCVDCGRHTDGSNGRAAAPERCWECSDKGNAARQWTAEACIAAIRRYNETYGHPPGAMDWMPAVARRNGRDDLADRFEKDGCWPSVGTVRNRFGRWNAAIRAAGFDVRGVGRPRVVRLVSEHLQEAA